MKGSLHTLINLTSLAPNTTSSLGTYVGLKNARRLSIIFRGSYAGAIGTTPCLDIYPAFTPSPGSIDTVAIGSITLAIGAAAAVKQRSRADFGSVDLTAFPYIVCKVRHRMVTGTLGPILAKAFVKSE